MLDIHRHCCQNDTRCRSVSYYLLLVTSCQSILRHRKVQGEKRTVENELWRRVFWGTILNLDSSSAYSVVLAVIVADVFISTLLGRPRATHPEELVSIIIVYFHSFHVAMIKTFPQTAMMNTGRQKILMMLSSSHPGNHRLSRIT